MSRATPRSRVGKPRRQPEPFWDAPVEWPLDDDGHVFLATAVDRVGRAKFGKAWVGTAGGGTEDQFPPGSQMHRATPTHVLAAVDVLKELESDLWNSAPQVTPVQIEALSTAVEIGEESPGILLDIQWGFDSDIWDKAKALIDQRDQTGQQWDHVLSDIWTHCRAGKLRTFARDIQGGGYRAIEASAWNYEGWRSRFDDCLINESDPFEQQKARIEWDIRPPGTAYIFVSAVDLTTMLQLRLSGPLEGLPAYVSPYVHALIQVSKELNMSATKHVPDKEIDAALQDVWMRGGRDKNDLSDTRRKAMAAILREPGMAAKGRPKKIISPTKG